MKVKGPIFIGDVAIGSSDMAVDLSISTPDLIAELEKRRPCIRCARNGSVKCADCKWCGALILLRTDYFKDAK